MNDSVDPLEGWIGRGPPAGAPGACPDDNQLAGYAEGRLPAARRPALEAHLARCEVCRGLVAATAEGAAADAVGGGRQLRQELLLEGIREGGGTGEGGDAASTATAASAAPLPSLEAARARRSRRWALAAAVALFALGAGLAFRAWNGDPTPAPFDVAVAASAEDLRALDPTLLAELRPLTPAERAGGVADAARSGVRILEPAGTLLSPQAQVVWEPVPGATLYVVTISDAKTGAAIGSMKTKGTLVATAGKALLVPGGAYLVEVVASGDLGTQKASRAFQVATPEVAREFAAAADLLERRAKPRDVAYLTASLAIRRGLLLEAEKVLARAAAQGPTELGTTHPAFDATVELRAHVRRLLSWAPVPTSR